jgi:hypothetical protein
MLKRLLSASRFLVLPMLGGARRSGAVVAVAGLPLLLDL